MNINIFLNVYKTKKTDEERLEFFRSVIKNEYVPYEEKANVAKSIVDTCVLDKDKRNVRVDSVAKYMLTCMAMVDLYTTIERNKGDGKMLDDFNALNKIGFLDAVVRLIDQRELKEFNMVLKMVYDDFIMNKYNIHSFVNEQVERFGQLIGESLGPILSQLDMEKIESVVKEMI